MVTAVALLWNHDINRTVSTRPSEQPPAAGTQATGKSTAHDSGSEAPIKSSPEQLPGQVASPATEGRSISVAERVKIIIAGHLQVSAAQLNPSDDFEADLGASPLDVYSLMQSLGLEYITIPSTDSSNLHTVGETINYIEKTVRQKQAQERKQKEVEKQKVQPRSDTGISIAERLTTIIAHHLHVDPPKIKRSDDFEVDLRANPSDVYFLMRDLEQEYNIKIPAEDSKNLHTVGETIDYIQMREHPQQ
jgi:acyl carrier protein